MSLLGWIGRQKARGIAALVFISILTPALGAMLKPYVAHAVFALLCVAFLRIDFVAAQSHLRHPRLVIAATLWTIVIIPTVLLLAFYLFGLPDNYPDLFAGLLLQTVASPMMATPAIALLMGLDATLVLMTLLLSTALVPISAAVLISFTDSSIAIAPMQLGWQLAAIIGGSLLIGIGVRLGLGTRRVAELNDEIDGVNILILFVFISAVMGDLGLQFLAQPWLVIGLTVITFVVFSLLFLATWLVFLKSGNDRAFSLALMASQRNMGLMFAATGGLLPDVAWLYFAVSQFPIYFAPALLTPLLVKSRSSAIR